MVPRHSTVVWVHSWVVLTEDQFARVVAPKGTEAVLVQITRPHCTRTAAAQLPLTAAQQLSSASCDKSKVPGRKGQRQTSEISVRRMVSQSILSWKAPTRIMESSSSVNVPYRDLNHDLSFISARL